jgi:hypothetical protein
MSATVVGARLFVVLALVGASTWSGCGRDAPQCFAGDYRGCTCGAANGYQACDVAQDAYGPCVCDGTTPGAVRPDAGDL